MPPSSIAWLDTSPDEQRRVREILALFTQPESRDELGIATVRDALSNALFPGTSVLQTRARYYLFVPWCFMKAAEKSSDNAAVRALAEDYERTLAETLKASYGGSEGGVIGARAGRRLKTLPSSMFWGGLTQFGILRRDIGPDGLMSHPATSDDAEELVRRHATDWHPTIPPVPKGFPRQVDGGFGLTIEEAAWLRERILDGAANSLLALLLQAPGSVDEDSKTPWQDRKVLAVARDLPTLDHARRFSFVMQGASRLYNVLTAEAYIAAGFTRAATSTGPYDDAYTAWLAHLDEDRDTVHSWDENTFWSLARDINPRISAGSETFVRTWVTEIREGRAEMALQPGSTSRRLIANRERSIKGHQSRLGNSKLLGMWNGSSMTGSLSYRWPQVRQLLTDIDAGLTQEIDHA